MQKLKPWISSALVVALSVAPLLARANDGADAKAKSEIAAAAQPAPAANATVSTAGAVANVTALLGVLVMKGVLAPAEANAIRNAAPEAEFQMLVEALARKGVVSASDLSAITPSSAATAATPVAAAAIPAQAPAPKESKPAGPAVVAAIAPLRVLPVDPPVKDGLKAAFTMGPVKMTPYGFLKATGVYDTSNPNGDDMPFPGLFLATPSITSTGPTLDPNFHLKARSARIGANFEWPDISSKLTLTGRLEGDFEGNFTEVATVTFRPFAAASFQSETPGCGWIMPPAIRRTSISKVDRTGRYSDPVRCPIFWKLQHWVTGTETSMSVLRSFRSG
jgi:hypothetical protein